MRPRSCGTMVEARQARSPLAFTGAPSRGPPREPASVVGGLRLSGREPACSRMSCWPCSIRPRARREDSDDRRAGTCRAVLRRVEPVRNRWPAVEGAGVGGECAPWVPAVDGAAADCEDTPCAPVASSCGGAASRSLACSFASCALAVPVDDELCDTARSSWRSAPRPRPLRRQEIDARAVPRAMAAAACATSCRTGVRALSAQLCPLRRRELSERSHAWR